MISHEAERLFMLEVTIAIPPASAHGPMMLRMRDRQKYQSNNSQYYNATAALFSTVILKAHEKPLLESSSKVQVRAPVLGSTQAAEHHTS